MTNQEVFDKVAKHLLTQNAKAVEFDECRYRTSEGLKCAVGCLIPDDFYSPKLEGLAVTETNMMAMWKTAGITFEYRGESLLNRLQQVHDNREPAGWREGLVRIAEDFSLNVFIP